MDDKADPKRVCKQIETGCHESVWIALVQSFPTLQKRIWDVESLIFPAWLLLRFLE